MGVLALKANLSRSDLSDRGSSISQAKSGGASRAEAEEFYKKYFVTFPGVTKYLEQTKKEARERGYTETLFGRRRYFPGINSGPEYMQKAFERQAANAPIQGTSADIIKIAMIEVDKEIEKRKSRKSNPRNKKNNGKCGLPRAGSRGARVHSLPGKIFQWHFLG